ncbi:MAG: S8 family serine peptidase [Acidobacteriota bacterium]
MKFVEGTAYRLRGGEMTSLGGDDLAGLRTVLRDYPVQGVERLFERPEDEILAERSNRESIIGERLPDLNLWYRFIVEEGTDPEALIDALNGLPEVEAAYPAPLPAPPPSLFDEAAPARSESTTPSFFAMQGYLNRAPGGIDARYAWAHEGGTGGNVAIVDVEYSYNHRHEDLKEVRLVGGGIYRGWGNGHGTSVLGELIAMKNGYGVTGIAHGAVAKFAGVCNDDSCSRYNPANAIHAATGRSKAGDVILIEQQARVCYSPMYGPLEWMQSVFDAIKVATASGRIVVEAAGNGNVNLDSEECDGKFTRSVRDSGAIIVGAGAPPDDAHNQPDRSRLYFSSYGSRVDLQGWGWNVVTTGYGDLYKGPRNNQFYTARFSGTSSVSPMVAGAAALLSSMARERGSLKTPAWVRSALVSTGSPQQDAPDYPASEHIGPRPDLRKAIDRLPPAPASYSGSIGYERPVFTWTRDDGAMQYRIEVLKEAKVLRAKTVGLKACGDDTCS